MNKQQKNAQSKINLKALWAIRNELMARGRSAGQAFKIAQRAYRMGYRENASAIETHFSAGITGKAERAYYQDEPPF